MSRIIIEGPRSFHVAQPADLLLDADRDRELAAARPWARAHMRERPDFGWVLGRFVEADNPNENGHIFGLDDLRRVHQSIVSTPLNMLHRAHHVVGAFVATQLVNDNALTLPFAASAGDTMTAPAPVAAAGEPAHPHVEALATFWRWVFPDEYRAVRAAFDAGSAFYSMEAVPRSLTCEACGGEFPYAGARSDAYCAHLNEHRAAKRLNDPHFVGGAMIIPPTRPGWRKADVTELAELIDTYGVTAGDLYDQVAASTPQLSPTQWEGIMTELLAAAADGDIPLRARTFAVEARLADLRNGAAMPDGNFVIENETDLLRALTAFSYDRKDRATLKRHIVARARRLGMEDLLPDTWNIPRSLDAFDDDYEDPAELVLAAYVDTLSRTGWDLDDPPTPGAHSATLEDGSVLWQLTDGWGEWYFHQDGDQVRWVAQKHPDLGLHASAADVAVTRADVALTGWGDQEWFDLLAARLTSAGAAERSDG